MLRTIGIDGQTGYFDDREAMTDFVIADESSLETGQGTVGRGIGRISRLVYAAHAENFMVPIEQARQVPGEHPDMLKLWVNDRVGIDHRVSLNVRRAIN